ncbi:hypothetical protein Pcinc_028077 [Petrolisthes cinctipes]|uniref:Mitochondrial genome maintenance exonuclease 1 n=1 Tax=Petrolisthes cinctipes TaxID=88211 RepID=A0AAE1F3R3_PETCI|nr:hypothetical protein Pcinc_028077 [Petrolisthes cinctipes]
MFGRRLLSYTLQSLGHTKRDITKLRTGCGSPRHHGLLYSTGDGDGWDGAGQDDYEALRARNAGDDVEEDTIEAEMMYFLGETESVPLREPEKYGTKQTPIKQCLAYTNKRLFGPLLETAQEKRRRMKMEKKTNVGQKGSGAGKLSKSTKAGKASELRANPLIYRSENAHLVGFVPGDKTRQLSRLVKHVPTVVLKFSQPGDDDKDFAANSPVPKSININTLLNFPLYRNTLSISHSSKTNSQSTDTKPNISTIGIFDGGYQKLPSVRKILDATMPAANRIALEKWKVKMIKQLGEEGFEQYRKGLLDRGNLLHGCIHSELSGVTPSVEELPTIQGMWTSLRTVLPNVSDVQVLESRLIHPYLHYQGALDCVGMYRGTPMLIEWKTSSKPKLSVKSMFDDPIQVAAYLGALNYDENYHLPFQAECALLVVAYDSGLPATIHTLTRDHCEHYWHLWRSRLMQFWRQHEENSTDSGTSGTGGN